MKLWIASDHAGFPLKEHLKAAVKNFGQTPIEWIDLGTDSAEKSVDYPNYAEKLCKEILKTKSASELLEPCGVLVCGSGMGMSMGANRFPEIRASLCESPEVARMSRAHNASNVLCLGSRVLPAEKGEQIFLTWISSPFEGDRHLRRVQQLSQCGKV